MTKQNPSRREARCHAFRIIFQFPYRENITESDIAEIKASYYEFITGDSENPSRPAERDADYIDRVVWGVFEHRNQIDMVISNFLRDWTIDRINKADLALMRLSIYEMLCESDVPLGVAVNEAVELAKEYGADESPSFINGVLGSVSREIRAKGREQIG